MISEELRVNEGTSKTQDHAVKEETVKVTSGEEEEEELERGEEEELERGEEEEEFERKEEEELEEEEEEKQECDQASGQEQELGATVKNTGLGFPRHMSFAGRWRPAQSILKQKKWDNVADSYTAQCENKSAVAQLAWQHVMANAAEAAAAQDTTFVATDDLLSAFL